MKKIVLTGGGTAGHITPHFAILPRIEKDFTPFYIGSKEGMEKDIMSPIMEYTGITTVKFKRSFSFSNFLIPFKLIKGIFEAKKALKKIRPDVIFSKGGFVAVPVVIAASQLKIPVITHESDYSLGLANRLIKNKCSAVCTSFETTSKGIKNGIFTGSPVRESIFNGNKDNIVKQFPINPAKQIISFIGGSLGSKTINQTVFDGIKKLSKRYNIIHIVGKNNSNKEITADNYTQVEYIKNVEDVFAASDLVITRGGANVLFELLAIKKPMLIIPLSKAESRGDQLLNAMYFKDHGFANVLQEENLNPDSLSEQIKLALLKGKEMVKNMKDKSQNGSEKIVELIYKYSK